MELEKRARLAAKHYLKHVGYRIIYTEWLDRFIIAENGNDIAFIDVFVIENMSDETPGISREAFEDLIYKFFLQEHEPIDMLLRYDIIELLICNQDRAIVRHKVNALQ